uniref:MuDR family transposase containing protein n=1 Tax=Solanum tuberosum TaxID=4113 RepID=M1AJA6_SOLTU
MANITILLRHSVSWISESDYTNYRIDGILLRENATDNDLVNGISTQLGIDCSRKRMEIRYMMEDNVTPMEIRNEMGMRFFMELKRRQSNCGLYPLCITTEKQNFGCNNNGEISFDQDTSMVEVGTVSVAALVDNRSVNALWLVIRIMLFVIVATK